MSIFQDKKPANVESKTPPVAGSHSESPHVPTEDWADLRHASWFARGSILGKVSQLSSKAVDGVEALQSLAKKVPTLEKLSTPVKRTADILATASLLGVSSYALTHGAVFGQSISSLLSGPISLSTVLFASAASVIGIGTSRAVRSLVEHAKKNGWKSDLKIGNAGASSIKALKKNIPITSSILFIGAAPIIEEYLARGLPSQVFGAGTSVAILSTLAFGYMHNCVVARDGEVKGITLGKIPLSAMKLKISLQHLPLPQLMLRGVCWHAMQTEGLAAAVVTHAVWNGLAALSSVINPERR